MQDDNNSKKSISAGQEKQIELSLTKRERECLTQALQGKNLGQIAIELNVAATTVYYYLNSAQVKLAIFIKQLMENATDDAKSAGNVEKDQE